MDLRNIQAASAAGGGLQLDRQGGRLAEERNVADITEQSRTSFTNPQDQISFSQDALRGSVVAGAALSAAGIGATDARNTRAADQNDAAASADIGAVTSGGAKQTERAPAPEGLSLDKLSGDLTFEYADINGAHSSITSPLQSTDSSRNAINPDAETPGNVTPAKNTSDSGIAEDVSEQISAPFEQDALAIADETAPSSRLAASASALPGTILDLLS